MLKKEALDVLALQPGATPTEIKEAYRDLVKVWHPDRFGSDARLREKAEEKLKQLNDAYRVLQADSVSGSSRDDAFSAGCASAAPSRNGRLRLRRSVVGVGWVVGVLGILLGCVAGYFVHKRGSMEAASAAPSSLSLESDRQAAAGSVGSQVAGGASTHPVEHAGRNVDAKDAEVRNRVGSAQYRVYSLSDAQTQQMESACASQREAHGGAAYQVCVKAQLDVITNAVTAPDLTGLSSAERESIEGVCSDAKRRHGADTYGRCLNVQMALLAAEPMRPDLSTLSEGDRGSIESACRSTKYREGPSAYDRCLVRFVKLLAESK